MIVDAVATHMQQMRTDMLVTLTWDQGKEMAEHKRLHDETNVPIYFCDPKSPWQRGTNENTNGLLRQYYPKRIANFSDFGQHDYDQVDTELNDRPRKILGYRTPAEAMDVHAPLGGPTPSAF